MSEIVGKDKSTIQKHLRQMENQGATKTQKTLSTCRWPNIE